MNRRNFIGKTSLLASLNLVGLKAAKAALQITEENPLETNGILYRTIGKTGIKVPIVNMGVMNATIPGLVVKSYEKGVRLFDTAWFYQNGMNEKMVGETLERLGVRNEVTVMSKIYMKEVERDLYKPDVKKLFLSRVDESLKRLRTDYIDILFHHAVSSVQEQNNPYIAEAMEELKAAGKIKHTAVSLHGDDAELLDDITEKQFYEVVMVMFNIARADDTKLIKSIQNASDAGVGIVAMKTQCGGGGSMWWDSHQDSRKTLGNLNQKAMLKWVLQHSFIDTAIPGYTTYDQLDENFSVAGNIELSTEEKEFLDNAQVKLAQSFCTGCGQCKKTCPGKLDVPKLMRTYMYAYQYQNMEHAMAIEKTISRNNSLQQCLGCDSCKLNCPRLVNVAQRIKALKELNFCIA